MLFGLTLLRDQHSTIAQIKGGAGGVGTKRVIDRQRYVV